MALGLIRNLFLVGGTHDGANLLFAWFATHLFVHRADLFLSNRWVLLNLLHDEIASKEEADYSTGNENANQRKDKNPNIDLHHKGY